MIGVDFGASYLDVAVVKEGKLARTYSIPKKYYSQEFLENILKNEMALEEAGLAAKAVKGKTAKKGALKANIKRMNAATSEKNAKVKNAISVVGKNNPNVKAICRQMGAREIGEIAAIGEGAKFLSGRQRFVALNVGTGTPIIFVDGSGTEHLAGTGIGGGTLEGLSKLLLGVEVNSLEALASKGANSLDLTIKDVVGGRLGSLPENATASNFGKAARAQISRKEDVSHSLLSMVGEILGVMGALAAKAKNCTEIVYTGRVIEENAFIRGRILETAGLFGAKAIFPKDAKYATAIGAAVLAEIK